MVREHSASSQQADVDDILLDGQVEPPAEDEGIVKLWHAKNAWLHTFIWSTVSTQAQSRFKALDDVVAYTLWKLLEKTFAERPEAIQKHLMLEIFHLNTDWRQEHQYIERILALQTKISRLGYPMHDWQLLDLVCEWLSG